jgi:hypothetical protein
VKRRYVVAGVPLLALVSLAVATVVYSTLSGTTNTRGSAFSAGSVVLSDNDAGLAALSLSAAVPGTSDTGCIRVTYGGSLDATLRLYAAVSGALAQYLTLKVTRGTDTSPAFDSCESFTPDLIDYRGAGPGVVYTGLLSTYPTTYDEGIIDAPGVPAEIWTPGESRSYKLTVTLNNAPAARSLSATANFSWEARSL